MEKIYLLRHGQPHNIDSRRRFLGQTDIGLLTENIDELSYLKTFFKLNPVNTVISSPLKRCTETTQYIFGQNCKMLLNSGFLEINMGDWDNKPFDEIKALYPHEFEMRGLFPDSHSAPNGESFLLLQKRALSALYNVCAHYQKPIAIVTHLGVIRSILCHIKEKPLTELFEFKVPYASMVTLDYNGFCFSIESSI